MTVGCYPGSFDPLTIAHLAIADAALDQCGLDRLDLVISREALGKDRHHHGIDERVAAIEAAGAARGGRLAAVVTDHRLLADIASGYDVLVVGADKWAQVLDPSFYGGSAGARDEAVARLPRVVCAPRAGWPTPAGIEELAVADHVRDVSSSAVRAGAEHWRAGGDAPATRSEPQTRQGPE